MILWTTTLLAVSLVATEWRHADRLHADLRLVRGPLPPPTQEIYERMMLADNPKANPKDPDVLPDDIGYAAPQDLETFLGRRRAEGRPVSEEGLRSLLDCCGRDTRGIILGALRAPEDFEVLVIRAQQGDKTVKDRLERVFEEKRADGPSESQKLRPVAVAARLGGNAGLHQRPGGSGGPTSKLIGSGGTRNKASGRQANSA